MIDVDDPRWLRWREEIRARVASRPRSNAIELPLSQAVDLLPEDRAVAALQEACIKAIVVFGGVARYADDPDRFYPAYDEKELERQNDNAVIQALTDGLLFGAGFDSRWPVDAPRGIVRADRWRSLEVHVRKCRAVGPGFEITDIMAGVASVQGRQREELRRPEQFCTLTEWYQSWSTENPIASEAAVWEVAKRLFPDARITREQIRRLRRLPDGQMLKRGRKPGKTEADLRRPL